MVDIMNTRVKRAGKTMFETILLLSALWPQRGLLRAQLKAAQLDVFAVDTFADASGWLTSLSVVDLVILDTHDLTPDATILSRLSALAIPTLVLTGPFDRAQWDPVLVGVKVVGTLVRPVLIGEVVQAAVNAVRREQEREASPD